jgi:hypothetical protein
MGDGLIMTLEGTDGPVWSIDQSGPRAWEAPLGGRPVIARDQIVFHAVDGIYRLDSETLAAKRLYALPRGSPNLGDILLLPDGGLLVAHQDVYDRRLIALNHDGTLRWQRSYSDILQGRQHLFMLGGRPFLLSEDRATLSSNAISLLAIDLDSAELTRVFAAGGRYVVRRAAPGFAVGDDRILINAGGGRLVMFDPQAALEVISHVTSSQ